MSLEFIQGCLWSDLISSSVDTLTASQFFHLHKYISYMPDKVPLFFLCVCTTKKQRLMRFIIFAGNQLDLSLLWEALERGEPHLPADWSGTLKRLYMAIAYVRWYEEKSLPLFTLATGRWQLKQVLVHLSVCTCVLWLWAPGKAGKPQLMTDTH